MDERQIRRRATYKSRDFASDSHQKRLDALFARQARDRAATHATLRAAARAASSSSSASAPPPPEETPEPSTRNPRTLSARPAPVALPEWLVAPPSDLGEWYAVPRPDGKRVFVVAAAGRTVVRGRDGRRVCLGGEDGAFGASALPGGRAGSRGMTVLDCVIPVDSGGGWLWVLDVMVWNDRYLHDCPAEFRFFWMRSRLGELEGNDGGACFVGKGEREDEEEGWLHFIPVPLYEADEAGLSAAADVAASAACGMAMQDGILLYARDAAVELGLTPAVLAWKDAATSAHFIETFPEPAPVGVLLSDLPLVATLLRVQAGDGRHVLQTSDCPPVVVADVPEEALSSLGKLWESRLHRVRLLNAKAIAAGSPPEIELVELAGYGRTVADSWSRLLFQCKARHSPTTLEDLKARSAMTQEEP